MISEEQPSLLCAWSPARRHAPLYTCFLQLRHWTTELPNATGLVMPVALSISRRIPWCIGQCHHRGRRKSHACLWH